MCGATGKRQHPFAHCRAAYTRNENPGGTRRNAIAKYNPDSWPAVWVLQLIANGNLHSFYTSREWKRLRREVLKHQRRRCWDCAHKAPAVNKRGVTVHHVKPLREREHQPCLPVRFLPLGQTPQAGRTCNAGTLVILQHTPRPVKSKSPGGRRPRNSPDKAARLRARGKNGPAKGRQQIRPCAGTLYPQFLGGAAKSRKNHAFLERGCRN